MTASTQLSRSVCGMAIAIATVALAPSAFAEENNFTFTCRDIGHIPPNRSEIARVI